MALSDEIRQECGITWEDEYTDAKIQAITARATGILNNMMGVTSDFETDMQCRQLLCALCRYIYNNAVEEFTKNFAMELTACRLQHQATEYAKGAEQDEQQTV